MEGADLQLPKVETEYTEVIVPKQEERLKFKEKTFSSGSLGSASAESVGFKKRKNNSSFKRNIRKRDDDAS